MDEKLKTMVGEIDTLKKVKEALEGDITRLQKIHNSLDAQAHTAQIKDEQDLKLKVLEKMQVYAEQERVLEVKRIAMEGRMDLVEELNRKLDARVREVEKREQKTVMLDEQIDDLNRQRSNFENYKVRIEAQLDQAKMTIAEANESFEKIKSEKDMIIGREIKVKEQERYWNDVIGKLEADKKKFEMERENILGLKQVKKEVVNV